MIAFASLDGDVFDRGNQLSAELFGEIDSYSLRRTQGVTEVSRSDLAEMTRVPGVHGGSSAKIAEKAIAAASG